MFGQPIVGISRLLVVGAIAVGTLAAPGQAAAASLGGAHVGDVPVLSNPSPQPSGEPGPKVEPPDVPKAKQDPGAGHEPTDNVTSTTSPSGEQTASQPSQEAAQPQQQTAQSPEQRASNCFEERRKAGDSVIAARAYCSGVMRGLVESADPGSTSMGQPRDLKPEEENFVDASELNIRQGDLLTGLSPSKQLDVIFEFRRCLRQAVSNDMSQQAANDHCYGYMSEYVPTIRNHPLP
jgi:hypothetical protein